MINDFSDIKQNFDMFWNDGRANVIVDTRWSSVDLQFHTLRRFAEKSCHEVTKCNTFIDVATLSYQHLQY